ncbi:hypothetical protein RhiirB3_459383, partial [Rhizophagus irregularis]
HIKLDAYVRACDEALLGRDGYQKLAAVEARLTQVNQLDDDDEYQSNPDGIMVDEQEISNGDTINLKLGEDGRNVGCKQNHVMLIICLLNEKDEVLKPDHQYSKEKYETLAKVRNLFKYQLQDLQKNGISVNGVHWPIELYFF